MTNFPALGMRPHPHAVRLWLQETGKEPHAARELPVGHRCSMLQADGKQHEDKFCMAKYCRHTLS